MSNAPGPARSVATQPRRRLCPPRRDALLACAAGFAMALCQALVLPDRQGTELGPGGWLDPLALVALVPLVWVLVAVTPRRAAWLGWLAGCCYFGTSLWWITAPMTSHSPIPWIGAVPILLALVAFLALFWAVATWAARRLQLGLGLELTWGLPLVWTAALLARNHLLTGFPWAAVGYSQVRSLWLAQLASLGGVYLVGFVVIWTNAVVAHLGRAWSGRRRPAWGLVAVWAVCLLAAAGWGAWRLATAPAAGDRRQLRLAVIQGNLDERARLRGWRDQRWVLERLGAASRAAVAAGAELVVWPEASLPDPLPTATVALDRRLGLETDLGAGLLLGAVGLERRAAGWRKTNSAFVVDGGGRLVGRYDKVHLVPFGEYVPLGWLLPWKWFVPDGMVWFSPGTGHAPLQTPWGELGVLICYEAVFPEIARRSVAAGAELLVNITNDAWFGRSAAPAQHLLMSRMRSIETDRWQVRAANTGYSAIVGPRGRLLQRAPLGLVIGGPRRLAREALAQPVTLSHAVALRTSTSVYVATGDWFAWACLAGTLVGLGLGWWRRRRH